MSSELFLKHGQNKIHFSLAKIIDKLTFEKYSQQSPRSIGISEETFSLRLNKKFLGSVLPSTPESFVWFRTSKQHLPLPTH